MFFIRILVIFLSTVVLSSFSESFAMSGSAITTSGSSTISKEKNSEKIDKEESISTIDMEEKKVEEKRTEKNLSTLAIETFKLQGNKILKDMYTSIEKVYPDPGIRIEVYTSIQKTLDLRKQKLEKSEFSDEAKYIFRVYIDYMVSSLEKKKKTLE